jgi:CIC family chloride channel protein
LSTPSGRAGERQEGSGSLVALALLSLLLGAITGLVAALFRITLEAADGWRNDLVARWAGQAVLGALGVIGAVTAASAVAAWLVRRFEPRAAGSGIPDVEAVLKQELRPKTFRLLPVKFFGGALAIGAGQALGREGPSVEMGGVIGRLVAVAFGRDWPDCRALIAAGAGAGLATAFNAPCAGAVFVLEEMVRRFEHRTTIATFAASAAAITVARLLLGAEPDFTVADLPYSGSWDLPLYLALGVVAGFAGVVYNRMILGTLGVVGSFRRRPDWLWSVVIGAAVGTLVWFTPELVGGGDLITQRILRGSPSLTALAVILAVRFALGPVSYAAGTPGGLFAPLLVVGAALGLVLGNGGHALLPEGVPFPVAVAVVGMAAFFTAVVRSPVTGIVLITEMTASFTLLLPMLTACAAAMVVPTLLGDPPIYDSLRERALRSGGRGAPDRKPPAGPV